MTAALVDLLKGTALGRETLVAEQRSREERLRHLHLEERTENERHEAERAKLLSPLGKADDALAALQARHDAAVRSSVEAHAALNGEDRRHDHLVARLRRARRDLADARIFELREQLDALANDLPNAPNLAPADARARVMALREGRARCDWLLENYDPLTLGEDLEVIRGGVRKVGVSL